MPSFSVINEPDVMEYMKIRKYVIAQIARCSGQNSMRLSSTREMAKRFEVSQPTVIRALKDLIADGHLIVKPGIGTFINPQGHEFQRDAKIFGFIGWDGKKSFVDRLGLHYETAFADALLYHSQKFRVQHCELTSSLKEADIEIAQGGYDGIVWIFPRQDAVPAIKRLKAAGFPILCVGLEIEGVSSFHFDFAGDNYNVVKLLLQEGRKKIMLVSPSTDNDSGNSDAAAGITGVRAAFADAGQKFDPSWIVYEDELKSFGRVMDLMHPDAIIFNVHLQPFMAIIKERVDIVNDCRLYCGKWSISKDMGYHGYLGNGDLHAAAEAGVMNLVAQIETPESAAVMDYVMEMEIVLQP